ncbi:SRPBCC family protein [Chryseobacterium sp. PTM-20240506]|uniref:SRPBCC family protein n=1 Tax=unclassified Chryseobacterium TaxID=2593645 RepID=UPI002796B74C|nr:SRPBCC family protein [Chryseobacterium sp. CKR4-1]MDQ1803950.1 SRPBCC family protein [Chryseobacterium sp. CKR4-1]
MKKFLFSVLALLTALLLIIGILELTSSYKVSEDINRNAPVQTQQHITIHASPEKIYQTMSDVNHWSAWNKDIQDPVMTVPFQKGNSFDWKSGGLTIRSTLHTAIPYRKIGWSGQAFGAFAIHNWTFVPNGVNTTVVVDESMEGWLVTMMHKKFQSHLEHSLQEWLRNLKIQAEK